MKSYNLNEQPLAFERVLPWEGQVPAFVREGERCYLQIAAPEAESVSFLIEEAEHPCRKDERGIWRTEYKVRKGIHLVQLLIDGDVLKAGYFACHPCINTSSLRFRTGDLMDKVIPAMRHEPKIVEL